MKEKIMEMIQKFADVVYDNPYLYVVGAALSVIEFYEENYVMALLLLFGVLLNIFVTENGKDNK